MTCEAGSVPLPSLPRDACCATRRRKLPAWGESGRGTGPKWGAARRLACLLGRAGVQVDDVAVRWRNLTVTGHVEVKEDERAGRMQRVAVACKVGL